MQAVILAAGLGTRMGELTRDLPKPMLKIRDKTLLEQNIAALPEIIDEVVLVVGYKKDYIRDFVGNNFLNKKITYVRQAELKGTGHALSLCKDILRGRFLVIMGDDLYCKADLEKLIEFPLAILVVELQNDDLAQERQAILKMDENGTLVDIIERQPALRGILVNTGAYVLDARFFEYPLVPAGMPANEFGLPQTFLQLARDGIKIDVVKATWWHKVGVPKDLV